MIGRPTITQIVTPNAQLVSGENPKTMLQTHFDFTSVVHFTPVAKVMPS